MRPEALVSGLFYLPPSGILNAIQGAMVKRDAFDLKPAVEVVGRSPGYPLLPYLAVQKGSALAA